MRIKNWFLAPGSPPKCIYRDHISTQPHMLPIWTIKKLQDQNCLDENFKKWNMVVFSFSCSPRKKKILLQTQSWIVCVIQFCTMMVVILTADGGMFKESGQQ